MLFTRLLAPHDRDDRRRAHPPSGRQDAPPPRHATLSRLLITLNAAAAARLRVTHGTYRMRHTAIRVIAQNAPWALRQCCEIITQRGVEKLWRRGSSPRNRVTQRTAAGRRGRVEEARAALSIPTAAPHPGLTGTVASYAGQARRARRRAVSDADCRCRRVPRTPVACGRPRSKFIIPPRHRMFRAHKNRLAALVAGAHRHTRVVQETVVALCAVAWRWPGLLWRTGCAKLRLAVHSAST